MVRRQFQRLRHEYEAIVREIEGDLGTLQWTTGWIPRPQFLPEKAKSHRSWKGPEKLPNPEQELWRHTPCKLSEATWEEMVLKKSEESSASPCRDNGPWLQAEQGRKPKKDTRGDIRDIAISQMENPATGPGLSQSQHELLLQELQSQRSHLAMELLWLQQAITSRKEYLILKQTLGSLDADQTRDKPSLCPDHGGKDYEKTWSQQNHLLEDQACGQRTTGEPDQADDSYQKGKSQPHKSSESSANIDKTSVGAEGREPFCRRAGPQLPKASDCQCGGNRYNQGPNHGGQTFKGIYMQQTKLLDDKTPGGLKSRSSCSGKART